MFVGREQEIGQLKSALSLKESSFIALYGRRRVGKTALIRHFCLTEKLNTFEFSGTVDFSNSQHLILFSNAVKPLIYHEKAPENWIDAFLLLEQWVKSSDENEKKIIFFDEVPWIDRPKSGFLGALSYFWNSFCTKRNDIILIICGSAASYMLKKVINNKGSLHGRLTKIIPVEQFDLPTVKLLLATAGFSLSDKSAADAYMAFGGVAKYLSSLDKSKTLADNITELCFKKGGLLKHEYKELYTSLFRNAKNHYAIMDALSQKWSGYTQKELAEIAKVTEAYVKQPLEELLASGFVSATQKFNQSKRDMIYRASDCFSFFYTRWMKNGNIGDWNNIISTTEYSVWSGLAFESLCHMHTDHIKAVLGIFGIETAARYWHYVPKNSDEQGSQIDLMLEHLNRSRNIDIIECKYYSGKFTVTKQYRDELLRKKAVFNEKTGHRYNIRLIFVTPYGVERNGYYDEVVNRDITIDELVSVKLPQK